MTIRKIIPPIHIHPILFVFIIISFLTGTFVEMMIILGIVLWHELGHYLAAAHFKWRINKVMLWIFGGVMDTDEHGNRPVIEEFIVTIAGPFQHVIIYVFMLIASSLSLLPSSIISTILIYNTTILVFNLLPIWPLDGGKLLFFLLSKRLSFQKAYHMIIIISILLCFIIIMVQLLFLPFTLSSFLIMVFLLIENRSDWKNRHFVFIRFLLNRYKGNNWIKTVKPIIVPSHSSLMEVFSQFKRDVKHSIYIQLPNDKRLAIDETDCLKTYFYDKSYHKTIGEVATITTM
ncbi:site-2 protease family protein [Paucisalibacillus sp. EB02]|uniref:site-2 protease family protein n=1 Tax=Paucisalibacillus sp. EB02 TaxID=1347087 RepID=UPI0004BC3154|nr:site-2 protease family protein [Paucisalibacillus sp. EB02]